MRTFLPIFRDWQVVDQFEHIRKFSIGSPGVGAGDVWVDLDQVVEVFIDLPVNLIEWSSG
jgi:hypothetical protein